MAMPSPAKPDPMIATRTSRVAVAGADDGLSSVLVTDRLLRGSRLAEQCSTSYKDVRVVLNSSARNPRSTSMGRKRTSLTGKSVLITGAARGIGAELARKAAARG